MEYMIVLNANASNTHFLGKHVQTGDELYLGLSEQDAEALCEQLLSAISDRLKQKLERYNQQKKAFWLSEFREEEKNWKDSAWNSFTK
jgi:lipoate-protein ligase A